MLTYSIKWCLFSLQNLMHCHYNYRVRYIYIVRAGVDNNNCMTGKNHIRDLQRR